MLHDSFRGTSSGLLTWLGAQKLNNCTSSRIPVIGICSSFLPLSSRSEAGKPYLIGIEHNLKNSLREEQSRSNITQGRTRNENKWLSTALQIVKVVRAIAVSFDLLVGHRHIFLLTTKSPLPRCKLPAHAKFLFRQPSSSPDNEPYHTEYDYGCRQDTESITGDSTATLSIVEAVGIAKSAFILCLNVPQYSFRNLLGLVTGARDTRFNMASGKREKVNFKNYIQAICIEALSLLRQVCQAQI